MRLELTTPNCDLPSPLYYASHFWQGQTVRQVQSCSLKVETSAVINDVTIISWAVNFSLTLFIWGILI